LKTTVVEERSMADTIGVIVPELSGGFLAAMMDAIHATAQERGTQVIVFEGSPEDIGTWMLADQYIAGWILFLSCAGLQKLNHKPVVAVSAASCGDSCPIVLPDNWGGIQLVMQHLFEHGHERIAFIGCMDNVDIQQRYASYQAALAERGFPVDPRLAVDTHGYFEEHGRNAIQALLDGGCSFTAVVTAGDFNAFGAVEALRQAGYRVPEDVAVTGFDDVPDAQFADPPLTTVRQRPEMIGKMAAEQLLKMIAGQPVAPGEIYAPTALVRRQSCACDTMQAFPLPDPTKLQQPDWQDHLAAQLVFLARYPVPLEPGTPPAQVWPGAVRLVEGLAATLEGRDAPSTTALEQDWREAIELTGTLDILHTMLKLLDSAAAQRLLDTPENQAVRNQVTTFLDRARLALLRARLNHEVVARAILDQMARTNNEVDRALLNDQTNVVDSFEWLQKTTAEWACLGLWTSADDTPTPRLKISGIYQRHGEAQVALDSSYSAAAFPPAELLHAAPAMDAPSNIVLIPVTTATRRWGILALRLPTTGQVNYAIHGLKLLGPRIGAKLERESLLDSLRKQQETLNEGYERERALASTIRELGCPILPLLDNVLLVPLVGSIDSSRAQQIIELVLDGIHQHQASFILLDITGVPLVDTQVASSLLQTANAAKLLGAQVIMVGVRPEIAQSIIGLGLDLRQIITYSSLAAALTSLQRIRVNQP
jgi:DNA-binding LacI/PurR family transcriptional regulator/anti-anti-sigma regulatory factor